MKKTFAIIAAALLALVSCSRLDTVPEDYYSSGSYWTTTAQAEAYLRSIYSHLRDVTFTHTIRFGELGAGAYVSPISTNGNNVSDQPVILHNLSPDIPGAESWGGLYEAVSDCNLFLEKVSEADYIPSEEKDWLLAQVYGVRALLYFDLYRIWGGVPLRLEPDLAAHGENDVRNLYLARSTASETVAQIMSDIDKSIELFGSLTSFDPYGLGSKILWNKAASECLAAEILLWRTKVGTADCAAVSDGSLLPRAKTLLEDVLSNFSLSLEDDFASIFDASNKAGKEVIFAVSYAEGEATNQNGSFTYHTTTGEIHNMLNRGGEPFGDPLQVGAGYNQVYEYIPQMYLQYEGASATAALDAPLDSRADATFIGIFGSDRTLKGTVCRKNVGKVSSGTRVMCGDYILYRLAWVHLTLAEIANYQGSSADFEKHLNAVRKRAYGSAWSASREVRYASFAENELAVLAEKDREFVQEGQRWWDLRRLQAVRGDDSSHLLLRPEGNPAADGTPVLNEAFRALWPVSTKVRANDPLLAADGQQNPGY